MISNTRRAEEDGGYMLVGLLVVVAIIMLFLGVAAPKVARGLRRDREVESLHRGNEYVRAIQLYYRKFGRYPGTLDQLEKTNNIRFLRKQYDDPMTGKPDWRTIPVGKNQTTVKGFFGQPLVGLATSGLGSAAGLQSPGVGGATGASGASGATGAVASTGSVGSTGFGAGITSQSATSFTGGGAFMGIGSSFSGDSIVQPNEQTTFETWEFLYDPRIEALKAKASLLGGPPTGSGTGTAPGASAPTGATGGTGGTNGPPVLGAPVTP